MTQLAQGTFDIVMTPAPAELAGTVNRIEFTKQFHGGLDATGIGVLLSAGDPASGTAGYVAIETVEGSLDGRSGGFALQQFGTMFDGAQTLHYEVVPGSGRQELGGITGVLRLHIEQDGTHHYELEFVL